MNYETDGASVGHVLDLRAFHRTVRMLDEWKEVLDWTVVLESKSKVIRQTKLVNKYLYQK